MFRKQMQGTPIYTLIGYENVSKKMMRRDIEGMLIND